MKKIKLTCLACCVMLLLSGCKSDLAKQPPETVQDPSPVPAVTDTMPPPVSPEPEVQVTPIPKPLPTPVPLPPDMELNFDNISMAFGFSDLTGNRLLVVENVQEEGFDYDGPNYEDPAHYTLAIGPYSELVHISYSDWQDETAENDYRDAAYNFDNLSGYVYTTVNGQLLPDNTYVLTTEGLLAGALIKLLPPSQQPGGSYGYVPPTMMDAGTEDYIRAIKGREVQWGELLAETEDGGQIGMVLFERLGNDMLFSIVYIDGDNVLFWDCPGQYDDISTWRVDMGDEPGAFTPLILARLENELMLLLTWRAPEGELIVVLNESNGRLVETSDYAYGRYLSPA